MRTLEMDREAKHTNTYKSTKLLEETGDHLGDLLRQRLLERTLKHELKKKTTP